jgi:hypothetical protein
LQELQEKARKVLGYNFIHIEIWIDGSALFETDIYIEKSVLSRLDEHCSINSLIDFGKFIFKENTKKINENNRLYSNIQN